MRPRIVHLIPTLDWGSAESQLLVTIQHLRDSVESHICTTRIAAEHRTWVESQGATVHCIRSASSWETFHAQHLFQTLRSLRPDILHAWRVEGFGNLMPMIPLIAGPRLILDERMPRRNTSKGLAISRSALRLMNHLAYPEASQPSTSDLIWVPAWVKLQNSRQRLSLPHESIHQQLDIPDNKRIVAVVGWLHRRKRIEDVIWALDLLQVVRDDVILVLFGSGPDEPRLRRWAECTQILEHVRFAKGFCSLEPLWSEFACVVFASEDDDPPLALVEAVSHHVPVIASHIDSHVIAARLAERNRAHADGYPRQMWFEVGDRAEIARCIEQAIEIPSDQCTNRPNEQAAAAGTESAVLEWLKQKYGLSSS